MADDVTQGVALDIRRESFFTRADVSQPLRETMSSANQKMAGANRELPARIPPELEEQLRHAAERITELAGVRGVARIDYLSDGASFVVNEVNTVPGSLARYLWVAPAVPFATLLSDLLDEARRRPTHAYSAAGADGTVLRSAGSIAGKLG